MSKYYKLDYSINTSITVSMVDFKNKGLTDEEMIEVVEKCEYVNTSIMLRSFSTCEITFYSSYFNKVIIENTVEEIEQKLNILLIYKDLK